MGFLKSKQRSTNMEQPWINSNFKPLAEGLMKQGQAGLGSYMGALDGSDNGAAYETYKDSTGYENIFNEAMRGVSSNAAAKGLLASGSTVRGLADRGGQLARQNFSNYLQQLLGGSKVGLEGGINAGNTVANVGAQSERTGGWRQILGDIGQVASTVGKVAAMSDPLLKDDIELLEREPDGLGIYAFRYKWDDPDTPLHIGVMADEVAALRPHALGPEVDGFMSVDYGAL